MSDETNRDLSAYPIEEPLSEEFVELEEFRHEEGELVDYQSDSDDLGTLDEAVEEDGGRNSFVDVLIGNVDADAPVGIDDQFVLGEEMPTGKLQLVTRQTQIKEFTLMSIFFACAIVAVLGVTLIFAFVAYKAFPIFTEVGIGNFLTGTEWSGTEGLFGIVPFIVGSFVVTIGALVIGAPLAVMTAVFMSELASPKIRSFVRPAVELLAGIPSVVYGFFGVVVVAPFIARLFGGVGFGPLTAWIILAIMIVPTIATLTEDALGAIPMGIREASFAMGANQWQTIYKVVLPAAKLGIIDAIILGMGRAIGETMAVLMVVGNAPQLFAGITAPISTLTSQIVLDMGYATGTQRTALFGMAAILFLISMSLVLFVRLLSRFGQEMSG
ncbi:MAG: phosphate ABC transporter permease subunit PstC [Coriobacteriia bacterium]|nr:phosphate ABC transporter permease subunit PstC [Coriobacteriia bacterium]